MKKKHKLVFFLMILSILSSTNNHYVEYNEDQVEMKELNIDTSLSWNLTGVIIEIDNLNPNKSWSKIALDNEWCVGTGTWSDPYIIENISMNSLGLSNCIRIENSNEFFIIRNITLYSSIFKAIYLYNTTNGKIIDNTIIGLDSGGVKLQSSNNLLILQIH